MALATIVVGVLLVVPTAYWIQLRLPRLRPVVEFITLLPLVIPAIVIVFGYLRHLQQLLAAAADRHARAAPTSCSTFGYVTLALPYMYRAVDTGLRAIDVRTLTEAAESPGRQLADHPVPGDLAQYARRGAQRRLSHLRHRHRRVHHGEPARPPGLRPLSAADRRQPAYEPAALAIIAFAVTWACMGLIQLFGAPAQRACGTLTPYRRRMAFLEIDNLRKTFGTSAWSRISSSKVERGEFISFLGPAAAARPRPCAWSPASRCRPPARIRIDEHDVTHLRPNQRKSAWCSSPTRCSPT